MGNLEQLHASGMVVYATEGGVANSTWSLGSGYFLPLLFFSFPSLFFPSCFFPFFHLPSDHGEARRRSGGRPGRRRFDGAGVPVLGGASQQEGPFSNSFGVNYSTVSGLRRDVIERGINGASHSVVRSIEAALGLSLDRKTRTAVEWRGLSLANSR